jgi:endonuclease III
MTKKERYQTAIAYFEEQIPIAETELLYDNPFQLLVAVILSAQCTDKRVNLTTPYIFQKYPDPQTMAQAGFDDLFPLIRSISYPNNKTKHLIGMANMLLEKFEGEVPMTVEELVQLPGVGRKTANVITSVIDKQPNMAVDTHVFRVSARLGSHHKCYYPAGCGKTTDQKYSRRIGAQSPSLAHLARKVYLLSAIAQMRRMRFAKHL